MRISDLFIHDSISVQLNVTRGSPRRTEERRGFSTANRSSRVTPSLSTQSRSTVILDCASTNIFSGIAFFRTTPVLICMLDAQ